MYWFCLILIFTNFGCRKDSDWLRQADESKDGISQFKYYTKAIQHGDLTNKQKARALHNRGYLKGDKGDYDEAIVDYTKAIDLDPNNEVIYFHRGKVQLYKGNYDRAIDDLNKAIKLDAEYVLAYSYRGYSKRKKDDFDGAIKDFNKAIELNSDDVLTFGRIDEEPLYGSGKGFDQNNFEEFNNRGTAKALNGDYEGAIADFNKAMKINPNDEKPYHTCGIAKSKRGDFDGAIAEFNKAIELKPKYARAFSNRGNIYFYKKEFKKAIEDYQKYLEIKPKNKYRTIWLYLAKFRNGNDDLSHLKKFYKKMKDKDKWPSPVFQMYLGKISPDNCLSLTKHRDLKKDKEQKMGAHFYIGQYWLIKGDKIKAKENFQKCVDTGTKNFTEYTGAKAELKHLEK